MTATIKDRAARDAEKIAQIAREDRSFTTHEMRYDDGIEVKVCVRYALAGYANELPDGRWQITLYKGPDKGYRPGGIARSKDAAIVAIATRAK